MPAVVDNLSGVAQEELQLILPEQKPVNLNKLVVIEKSLLSASVNGSARHEHTLQIQNTALIDNLFKSAMATGTPRFRHRIGFGKPNSATWLPWQEHHIVEYAADTTSIGDQAGHLVNLVTSDALYAVGRANKTRVRKGLISSILREIAAENELKAVIESTKGEFLFIQNFIDDIQFVRERLIPRSINEKGHGNFLFYMRDNILHFHTQDYQTEVKEWHYYDAPHSILTQKDNSQVLWDAGVSGTRLISYDPLTGETKEIAHNPENVLRLADGIYKLNTVAGGQLNLFYHIGSNRLEESAGIAQNVYSKARQSTFQLVTSFHKTIDLRIGDLVKLIIDPNRGTSPWSGFYLVDKLVYETTKGSVIGTFNLTRGEIQSSGGSVAQESQQQLVPITKAPGHDLNQSEVNQSVKTKGAGPQSSDKLYVSISDPSTAP